MAFGHMHWDILPAIGPWFLAGSLLAGLVTVAMPDGFLSSQLGSGLPAILTMLAISIPLYMCASASTPLAAALVLKGLSPGGALVLLMAGPATNLASLAVVSKILGRAGMLAYLGSIILCTILLALGVDALYAAMGWDVMAWAMGAMEEGPGVIGMLCGGVLAVWTLVSIVALHLKSRAAGACCGETP